MKSKLLVSFLFLIAFVSDIFPADFVLVSAKAESGGSGVKIDHIGTINLPSVGGGSLIKKITFSPDGSYLAIVDDPNISTSTIIIWDVKKNREQTKIVDLPPFGDWRQVEVLWSRDGKNITYGGGKPIKFWDSMSGKIVKEIGGDGPNLWSRYNRDRTKLLVNMAPGDRHGGFRIYNTDDWTFKYYEDGGLYLNTMCWTADDNIMVAGEWARADEGRAIDGKFPKMFDIIIRIIDPVGRAVPKSVLIPAIPPTSPGQLPTPALGVFETIVSFEANKIKMENSIIDGKSLDVRMRGHGFDDYSSKNLSYYGGVFSHTGKYIYIPGVSLSASKESLVVETETGRVVSTFPGGRGGLAISDDGAMLAQGNGKSIELYSVK